MPNETFPDIYRYEDTKSAVAAASWSGLQDVTVDWQWIVLNSMVLLSDNAAAHKIALYEDGDGDATEFSDSDCVGIWAMTTVADPSGTATLVHSGEINVPMKCVDKKIYWKVYNANAGDPFSFRVLFYLHPAGDAK